MRAPKIKTGLRQEQIAKAALALMLRHGWKKVSVVAVAKKVGIAPSDLYRHYGSKDEVMDAVLELVRDRLLGNVAAAKQDSDSVLEQLRGLVVRHVQLVRGELPIPRVVFSEEVFSGSSQRRKRVHGIFQAYLEEVAELIRAGQSQGQIQPELPADTLALMFLGLVQPAAILWLMSGGDFDLGQHCERAWQIYARTIEAPRARPSHRIQKERTTPKRQRL